MGKKNRLSAEEKFKIVNAYRSGAEGKASIRVKYGVAWSTLRDWIRIYETRGVTGLISYGKSKRYSPETKVKAVEEYLVGKWSQSDICRKYDISSTAVLRKWIDGIIIMVISNKQVIGVSFTWLKVVKQQWMSVEKLLPIA